MPRKLRLEYRGAICHVVNRGDRREDIFRDDEDRERLLATLGEACAKTQWQVHAYCLMRNHVHLVRRWAGWKRNCHADARETKGKVKLARQLRAETTMTVRWIADRLRMGSWTYVSNPLREKR